MPGPFFTDPFPKPEDAPAVLRAHGYQRGSEAWLSFYDCDVVAVHAATPIYEMRGSFGDCCGYPFPMTFVPNGAGRSRALVLPVFECGTVVDFVAINRADPDIWGLATVRPASSART